MKEIKNIYFVCVNKSGIGHNKKYVKYELGAVSTTYIIRKNKDAIKIVIRKK